MNTSRMISFLMVLTLGLMSVGLTGCPNQSPAVVIGEVQAGINDAVIAINTIESGVNAYFVAHPDAALQAKIQNAVADVTSALSVVNTALAGAASVSDGNVQSALTTFSQAYSALVQLVAQIGVQASPAVTVGGRVVVRVPTPRILTLLKPSTAPSGGTAPSALSPGLPASAAAPSAH